MSRLEVLNYTNTSDRKRWLSRWKSWPEREIWAHPSFVNLFAKTHETAICLSYDLPEGGLLLPLIIRDLSVFDWLEASTEFFDATSPYGYSEVFSWGECASALDAFPRDFHRWANERGVISTFVRLNLLSEARGLPHEDIYTIGENVIKDLRRDDENLWYSYEHKVRKNVKKARRENLLFEIDPDGTHLEEFLGIYYSTMKRNRAKTSYYFSEDFFGALVKETPDNIAFAHVRTPQGEIVSTELLLTSSERIYSFLGGTLESHFSSRPNDLLKHEVIRWGRDTGRRYYILGGGYARNDGIFRYKKSFAPKHVVPFQVAKIIHSPERYESLIDTRVSWESKRGVQWSPSEDFFPKYRS